MTSIHPVYDIVSFTLTLQQYNTVMATIKQAGRVYFGHNKAVYRLPTNHCFLFGTFYYLAALFKFCTQSVFGYFQIVYDFKEFNINIFVYCRSPRLGDTQ